MGPQIDLVRNLLPAKGQLILEAVEETADGVGVYLSDACQALAALLSRGTEIADFGSNVFNTFPRFNGFVTAREVVALDAFGRMSFSDPLKLWVIRRAALVLRFRCPGSGRPERHGRAIASQTQTDQSDVSPEAQ
jgi:hypothetical protein